MKAVGLVLALALAGGLSCFAEGVTYYVATNGDDASTTPTDPATPLLTLAEAYNRASDGDTVSIATGTYKLGATVTVAKGVTFTSTSGVTEDVKVDGGTTIRPFILDHADAKLYKITVQRGKTSAGSYSIGGNVWIRRAGGTVDSCILRGGNAAAYSSRGGTGGYGSDPGGAGNGGGGGAIGCNSAAGVIVNCVITNNKAAAEGSIQGGGVYMSAGLLKNSFIAYNTCKTTTGKYSSYCGGVFLNSSAKMENCTIARNVGNPSSAVDAYAATVQVKNCLIWENSPCGVQGDVYAGYASAFFNCVARLKINDSCVGVGSLPYGGPLMSALPGSACLFADGTYAGCAKVETAEPSVAFSVMTPGPIFKGSSVTLKAGVANITGITKYQWDFDGNGTVDEETDGPEVTHTYANAGPYAPKLTVAYGTDSTKSWKSPAAYVRIYPKKMYVNGANASPVDPFDDENKAAKTIADALAICADGQEIVVLKAGSPYQVSAQLEVLHDVTLHGETGNPADVIVKSKSNNVRPLYVSSPKALVHGFAFQNLSGNDWGNGTWIDTYGGTVSNCIVRNSKTTNYHAGGVVYGSGATALYTHCVVTNNVGNADGRAKALAVQLNGGATIVNSLIADNRDETAKDGAFQGALYIEKGFAYHCTIVNNVSRNCGGVSCADANSRVVDCVIAGNLGTEYGHDRDNVYSSGQYTRFDHCACESVLLNETCVQIDKASAFVNYAQGNYRVAADSPLKNAGDIYIGIPAKDLDGLDRVSGGKTDIGCYEFDSSAFVCGFSSDVSEGLVPAKIVFTASTSGTEPTDVLKYDWDVDGDGEVDETTDDPQYEMVYETAGSYSVILTVRNLTTGKSASLKKENAVYCVPKTMYVNSKNETPESPFDSPSKAAKTIADVLAVCADGQEIIVLKAGSPYVIGAQLNVSRNVTLRGETGNPEDVILKRGEASCRILRISASGAVVRDLVVQGGWYNVEKDYGCGVRIDGDGGTLSNCVVRGCTSSGYWQSAAVYATGAGALVTHCVISNNVTDIGSEGTDKTAGLGLDGGAVAKSCLIADNRENETKGGCCTAGAYLPNGTMYNCTVVNNSARRTGGVRIDAGGAYNCVLAGNKATNCGAAYDNLDSAAQRTFFHNCAFDTEEDAETCVTITATGVFRNYAKGDFRPAAGTALVNGGASYEGIEATDLDGFTRVSGGVIDIGCYEFDSDAFTGSFVADKTTGIAPADIVFTASTSGENVGDVIEYDWDFDGDGVVDVTTPTNKVLHRYAAGGDYTVKLTLQNKTSGEHPTVSKPSAVKLCGEHLYVVPMANANAAFPYDTWETAAPTVKKALQEAVVGAKIVLSNGAHAVTDQIVVDKGVQICGLTGSPADVSIKRTDGASEQAGLIVNASGAYIHGLTLDGNAISRPGLTMEGAGGVVSNCVFRGFRNTTYHMIIGAMTLSGANALVTHCVVTDNRQTYGGNESKGVVCVNSGARFENSLVIGNETTVALPLVRGNGAIVNCTIVDNDLVAGANVIQSAGGLTNNLVLANTVGEALATDFNVGSAKAANNLCDVPLAGWKCAQAVDVIDAEAKTPWTISIGAISAGCRGDDKVRAPSVDLAGNPRKVGGRLDIGCYQCQKTLGFVLIVR